MNFQNQHVPINHPANVSDPRLSGEAYQVNDGAEGMDQLNEKTYSPFPQNKYKQLSMELGSSPQQ